MIKPETIEGFYQRKIGWVPDDYQKEIGHFNLFNLKAFGGEHARPVPYVKRDYYKIMIFRGEAKMVYADRELHIKRQALCFSNPFIPYTFIGKENVKGGYFCIFDREFFHGFGDIDGYSVFHPQGNHVYELDDEQIPAIIDIYERMDRELSSSYIYKYDLLRNLAMELIHIGLKMEPTTLEVQQTMNAAQRITTQFVELLERQFPIDDQHDKIGFRSASEYAKQLNVHVNHLNRAVKEVTQKTTSQLISERLLTEAKIMLRQSSWTIAEIAYALGFNEPNHFSSFFRKSTKQSPTQFRNG